MNTPRPRVLYAMRKANRVHDRFPGVRETLTRLLVNEVALPDHMAADLMPAVQREIAAAVTAELARRTGEVR